MLRPLAVLTLLLASATALAQTPPPGPPATGARPQADIDRDAARHPTELIAFAGVRPGMTVIDFWPGGGYWTRLFSAAVGPAGKVYEFVPAELVAASAKAMDTARQTAADAPLHNVSIESGAIDHQPDDHDVADVVFTFENYHDLHNPMMKGDSVAALDRAIFRLLKPGGLFVVADHAATAGSGLANTNDLHRIDPAAVRAEVTAAGFVFAGETKILANPADDHKAKVFDPAIRNKTDRFVYRFRKPRR